MGAAWSDAIAADLLAAATIASLGDSTLRTRTDFDDFHWQYSRHPRTASSQSACVLVEQSAGEVLVAIFGDSCKIAGQRRRE